MDLDLKVFVIAALAVYRISRMIANEEGPFSVFTKLRNSAPDQSWVERGLECPMCVSVWVALPVTILATVLGYADEWLWPLIWMALSAITVILIKWEQKK